MAVFKRELERGRPADALEMPPLDWGDHLIGWLFEVGPGNDGKPITWGEIEAWKNMTGTIVAPFEALALRSLSVDYIGELFSAKSPDRARPHGNKAVENSQSLKNALRRLVGKK